MSIDPRVLKRLLDFKLIIEGPSSWVFRELVDIVMDFFEERFALILNESLESYSLEASVLEKNACELVPSDPSCSNLVVVGIYEKESQTPLVYALYYVYRGENTLEIRIHRIIDATTKERLD